MASKAPTFHQSPDEARPPKPAALATVIVFLIVIAVPGLGLALGLDRAKVSESEMRELATWPAWSWAPDDLAAWPGRFGQYFEDHFMLRNRLIDWRASFLWNRLRTSGSETAIAGKDGWLFYAADGGLDDWTQAEPFTNGELEAWRETLAKRRAFLARRGIPFLFVIAPDKQMIYPEHMTDSLRRLRADYRADQLIAYLHHTMPDFEVLDLRPALAEAKKASGGELLYHRYDSHWNDRGGLVAYQTIIRAITHKLPPELPSVAPLERRDFNTDPTVPSGDRVAMLGLTDEGKQTMPGLVLRRGVGYRVVEPIVPDPYGEEGLIITEHANRHLPTLVMYRDSFAGRLIPYLSEHFGRALYLWQNEFDFDEIERDHPDVVVQEFVARHFFAYAPSPEIIPH